MLPITVTWRFIQIYILGIGSSREDVFECTNVYHTVNFFSCCHFFILEKSFGILLFGFGCALFFYYFFSI